ncbi:hypothetical protein GOP47_0006691, partial [Adiantum capillus-veneris]
TVPRSRNKKSPLAHQVNMNTSRLSLFLSLFEWHRNEGDFCCPQLWKPSFRRSTSVSGFRRVDRSALSLPSLLVLVSVAIPGCSKAGRRSSRSAVGLMGCQH